jgi:hypothetical protein
MSSNPSTTKKKKNTKTNRTKKTLKSINRRIEGQNRFCQEEGGRRRGSALVWGGNGRKRVGG